MRLTKIIEIAMLGLTSCAPMYIPEMNTLRNIENKKYDPDYFNCLDKARAYKKALDKKGIISRIAIGEITGRNGTNGEYHAWVEAYNQQNKRWFMIDPTFEGWKIDGEGFPTEYYPERKAIYFE